MHFFTLAPLKEIHFQLWPQGVIIFLRNVHLCIILSKKLSKHYQSNNVNENMEQRKNSGIHSENHRSCLYQPSYITSKK